MAGSSNIAAVPLANVKRKHKEKDDDEDMEDSGSDVSMVNVDFDFYNPNPEVDDIALKRLLNQLFTSDAQLFDVHALATLILSTAREYGVGSCVKVDGQESDPYAYLSVVDLASKASDPALATLLQYLIGTFPSTPTASPFRDILSTAAAPSSSTSVGAKSARVGLVISERLVNLPVQLIPPMYDMLAAELDAAVKEGNDKLDFTHFLLLSRVYKMQGSDDDVNVGFGEADAASKKSKKARRDAAASQGVVPTSGTFHYHPEEEFLEKVAAHVHTYPFKTSQTRDSESFGVEQRGRIILIERQRLKEGIKLMQDAVS